MEYPVHTIRHRDEIDRCPLFALENQQWDSLQNPPTQGRMAYWDQKGLLVRMACQEQNPKRELTQPMDMVCKDSAMEAFFAFPGMAAAKVPGFAPSDDELYFNFEINANGAMYAKYGHGRKNRQALSAEEYAATGVKACIEADSWSVEFLFPLELICRTAGVRGLFPGDVFFCNFYKISEAPDIQHFLSYSRVDSETPNFHLPRFFARAVMV